MKAIHQCDDAVQSGRPPHREPQILSTKYIYEARDLQALNSNILLLSKKHGQFKVTIQSLVEQSMGWLDEVRSRDGLEKWLELVDTLRQVTEGKVIKSICFQAITHDHGRSSLKHQELE